MSRKVRNYFYKLVSLIVFVFASILTLFFAYGYQYDLKNSNLKKTSIIDLVSDLRGAEISVNGIVQDKNLPFQVKNLLPDNYLLKAEKDGFLQWNRLVNVKEDIVTVVNDILLVPKDLNKYTEIIKSFSADGSDVFYTYGENFIIAARKNRTWLELIIFKDNGEWEEQKVDMGRLDLKNLNSWSDRGVLLTFADGTYGYLNINDFSLKFFKLPGVYALNFSSYSQTVYYLKDDDLYKIPLYLLIDENNKVVPFKVAERIKAYALGFPGQIYVISSGLLFKINEDGTQKKLVGNNNGDYINLSFKAGKDYGALILRNKAGSRFLYAASKNANLDLITEKLAENVFLNSSDHFIFKDNDGKILYFDPSLNMISFVKTGLNSVILGWFDNKGHFLVQDQGSIEINDIFDSNNYFLLKDIAKIYSINKILFYLKDNHLFRLSWLES